MSFTLYDFRSFFDDQQEELKFFKACQKKYGNFEELFLSAHADQYASSDWLIISYFANLSVVFINSFKEELEPTLLWANKYLLPDVKETILIKLEGSSVNHILVANRHRKLKVRVYPASWQ